jgi:hypothetical protein
MSSHHSTFLHAMLGLLLGFCGLQPLHAQLDPRLQSSKTDFLDLYQQSTSLKAKPEIATIFDCSGSMESLMFHPLYLNNDLQDADDYRYMSFVYHAASGGTAAANVYTITAKDANCASATAVYTVTVTSASAATGAVGANAVGCSTNTLTAPTITIEAYASACTTAIETLVFTPTAAGNNPTYTLTSSTNAGVKSNASGSYEMTNASGTVAPAPVLQITTANHASPYPTGTAFTFTSWLTHAFTEGEASSDKLITWSQINGQSNPAQSSWTEMTPDLLYKSVATWTIPNFVQTIANPAQLKPITSTPASGAGTFAPGHVLSLNTYFITTSTSPANITWTVSANTSNTCTGAPGAITGGNINATTTSATTASGGSVNWTIPAYCTNANSGATSAYVTVSLDPRVGSLYPAAGVTYLTSVLTANTNTNATGGLPDNNSALRKPDGTGVSAADANAAAVNYPSPVAPSLAYTHWGSADVRNWIRAASHVRFAYTIGSVVRCIDVPIPWKITDRSQALSSPLNSTTLLDQEQVTTLNAGNTVTTTYGSGTNIELDQTYKIENAAGAVFAADTNGTVLTAAATTTVYLYGVVYRPAYISWLFSGKYQNTNTGWPGYTSNLSLVNNWIVFDANVTTGASAAAGQSLATVAWGQGFGPAGSSWGNVSIPQYDNSGNYLGLQSVDASTVKTPSLTRIQAVKTAAIQTWINHQADVYWAFRELDPANEAINGTASTINNNSATTLSAANPATTHFNGLDSGWTVLNNTTAQGINSFNGNSVTGMSRISYLFANSQTPLTYAMARTLAQYEDPNSVFNAIEGANVSQCSNSFLMLFTDGIDNNSENGNNNTNTSTPYITSPGGVQTLDPKAGNDAILANPSSINRSGSYWNLFTFAGIAAHLSDPRWGVSGTDFMPQWNPGTGVTSNVPSTFLPYAVNQRNGVAFSKDHRVTIMTVGVSLGGQVNTVGGPKANLFAAAVVGDPSTPNSSTGTLPVGTFHTFTPPPTNNPAWPAGGWAGVYLTPPTYPAGWVTNDWVVNSADPGDYPTVGSRATGAVYFFDATNPTLVSTDMGYAFKLAIGSAGNNATSNPDLPFVGASLGQEIYLGSFQPPIAGGVIWPGDLMMFSTRQSNGTVNILDRNGNVATVLNSTTAEWAASNAMSARLWSARNLYTRLPSTSTTEPVLTSFSYTNAALLPYVATSQNNTTRQAVIQFAAGGDTSTVTAPNAPTVNRSNIMGDIIDSAPASVPYNYSQVSGSLTTRLSAESGNTFRLILVGTNQGWLHAFGEVSKTIADPNGDNQTLVTGAVDELWAFMPTDFLANLDYITQTNNAHRFMVDGSPNIYFLDLPPAGGGPGNGVVDSNERAVAIIGLRKGGRSYYALDIHNPFTPSLLWSLVPDEAANFPPGRIVAGGPSLATVQGILANFGFSTSVPAFGRITFNGILHDAVFLAGGLSEPEVEANFPNVNNSNKPTPLGRSVIALDVYTGQVLAAVDLTASTIGGATVGPVGAGIVPFEFILNSSMAQRAYFLDYTGGLWAWGSKAVSSTAPYVNFRVDTSELTNWSIRKVFQDDNSVASGLGGRYSTLPAPFLTSNFPGAGKAGSANPAAVGIAMVSGDRNNPLDRNYYTSPLPANLEPTNHQMTMVFDRQDSRAWNLDTALGPDTGIQPGIGGGNPLLVKLSAAPLLATPATPCSDPVFQVFTSTCPTYFLGTAASPKYGYYVNFNDLSVTNVANSFTIDTFVAKGINPPIVAAGSLLFSVFQPTASDPCTGGSGKTYSFLISDVMNPIVNDQRGGMATPSGLRDTWTGVASDYIAVGTGAVLQGGTVPVAGAPAGAATTTPQIHTTPTQIGVSSPKIRVWRTVQ